MRAAKSRPKLLYRGRCRKCRMLSRLAVVLSLGLIVRVPLESPEAEALLRSCGLPRNKLLLIGPKQYARS